MNQHSAITVFGIIVLFSCAVIPDTTSAIFSLALGWLQLLAQHIFCPYFPIICLKFESGETFAPPLRSSTPVFVLHGLGERTWTMGLFVSALNIWRWDNVYTPHWPANTCLLDDCLDALDLEMQRYANKSEPIFVIGNSMGGVMAYHLHTRNWNIIASYSIASPIKGSELYRTLKEYLPSNVFEYFRQPGHLYLERTDQPPEPPHPWHIIGYNFFFGFDGNVFLSDMPEKNRTVIIGTHYSLSMDPVSWSYISHSMFSHLTG